MKLQGRIYRFSYIISAGKDSGNQRAKRGVGGLTCPSIDPNGDKTRNTDHKSGFFNVYKYFLRLFMFFLTIDKDIFVQPAFSSGKQVFVIRLRFDDWVVMLAFLLKNVNESAETY